MQESVRLKPFLPFLPWYFSTCSFACWCKALWPFLVWAGPKNISEGNSNTLIFSQGYKISFPHKLIAIVFRKKGSTLSTCPQSQLGCVIVQICVYFVIINEAGLPWSKFQDTALYRTQFSFSYSTVTHYPQQMKCSLFWGQNHSENAGKIGNFGQNISVAFESKTPMVLVSFQ